MKEMLVVAGLLVLTATGCVTKGEANARAKAAFLAGERQGMAMKSAESSVWLVGNVRTPVIPWTEDLTLAKAVIDASYQGTKDPSQFVILRGGHTPTYVSAQQLLNGYDVPLQAGDRIEIRP